jgi:hypothetical protein
MALRNVIVPTSDLMRTPTMLGRTAHKLDSVQGLEKCDIAASGCDIAIDRKSTLSL